MFFKCFQFILYSSYMNSSQNILKNSQYGCMITLEDIQQLVKRTDKKFQ